ncbi:MAG TPA: FAD-dependent tricarballylate dehydrogenase TcuA [Candidatus Binataceae bacterium]|nr:FAD-dependent tricarballylate dehydrogenase TcuA [Candidatus Binataceae bacterium]
MTVASTGPLSCDVVVVGGGNAALCAALAARQSGASVIVLECAPAAERGGNSRFTAGAMRVAYDGVDDLLRVMPDLSAEELSQTDFGTYSADQFYDDLCRVTQYRTNPAMAETLVNHSLDTLLWLRSQGIRFAPIYGRQAFKIDGRFKFWGGLTVEAWGGGPGLIEALYAAAERAGITVMYQARALELIHDEHGVHGVMVRFQGRHLAVQTRAVVLACGGFEANAEMRTRYLGPGWDLAKVRGSRFNTGDGILMALEVGAMPWGNWSGCHAVGWDRNAPDFGDLSVGDAFQKHSYPFGIMVNSRGRRFVDEGADFRNYTYARYGRAILEQPGHFAWQIFDRKVSGLLRDEYRIKRVTRVSADSLEQLAGKLEDVDPAGFLAEVRAYNGAVRQDIPFNPNIKDGRATQGLAIDKHNWANPIDTPPFEAYAVTCGITFTFGGLHIDDEGRVINTDGVPITGLYAAGELVGGLFYFNYPGGSGLTAGSVYGRLAGRSAARALRS